MIITITGPSGSGKSYISDYLCNLNENIIHLNIDEIGHNVLEKSKVKEMIVKTFNITLEDGHIDRKRLGDIVFNNRDKMKILSDITWEEMEREIDEFIEKNKDKIIILDWILITKTKYFTLANLNILVKADFNNRVQRATARDGITVEKFYEREKATVDYSNDKFDYVICNDDLLKTKEKVKKIYDKSIISR